MFVSKVTLSLGSQISTLRFLGFFQTKQRYTRHATTIHHGYHPMKWSVLHLQKEAAASPFGRFEMAKWRVTGFSQSLWNTVDIVFSELSARKLPLTSFPKKMSIFSLCFSHYFSKPPSLKKLQNTWIQLKPRQFSEFHTLCHMDKAPKLPVMSGSPSKIPTYQGPIKMLQLKRFMGHQGRPAS